MTKTTATLESRSSKTAQVSPAISYKLSEKYFLDIGWTAKPNIPSAIPVVVMRAKFSHPCISPWLRPRLLPAKIYYANGNIACHASPDGSGNVFYPNGRLAMRIEQGGRRKESTKVWVYSPGEVDLDGVRLPTQLCALFDSLGNGVVYDSRMRKRLVYNQKEGVLWDSPHGVPVMWKWHDINFQGSMYRMNEEEERWKLFVEPPKPIISAPSRNQKEREKESKNARSPPSSPPVSTKLTISEMDFPEEFPHLRYLDTEKLQPKNVSPVKPIVLRFNKYLALRIFSQSDISLNFIAETRQTTLQIGVLYNPFDKLKLVEIENSTMADTKVICPFEDFPPNTSSMLSFKKMMQATRT